MLLFKGKSLIYIKNNNEPKTDPCGTPVEMSKSLDLELLNSTNCNRSVK